MGQWKYANTVELMGDNSLFSTTFFLKSFSSYFHVIESLTKDRLSFLTSFPPLKKSIIVHLKFVVCKEGFHLFQ